MRRLDFRPLLDVSELRQRSARIQHLEAQILASKKTPAELTKVVKQIETTSCTKLADLRAALAHESDRREAFLALFSDGLTFAPARTPGGERQVWRITGDVDLGSLVDASGSKRIRTRSPANDLTGGEQTAGNPVQVSGGSNRVATPTCCGARWTATPLWNWYLRQERLPKTSLQAGNPT